MGDAEIVDGDDLARGSAGVKADIELGHGDDRFFARQAVSQEGVVAHFAFVHPSRHGGYLTAEDWGVQRAAESSGV